jgi:tRNA U34 5-methylaminomethyl-2-thiouridine-forming methyltransferase MnmC
MPNDQHANLDWRDEVIPVSRQFDDPYFSLDNGLAETRHVFLDGNDLRTRLRDGFHIAELGFGTGLNMLATALLWAEMGAPGTVHFTSFEAFPLQAAEIERALRAFPEAQAIAAPYLDRWASGAREFDFAGLHVTVVIGDARDTLPAQNLQADAWFLDGFSPAKNPELWAPELMAAVGAATAPNGTCATYTAAGHVRRSLTDAGFEITRIPGFGRKRHMTVGKKPA